MTAYTDDDFLDGKVKIRQPEKGYRAGADAVLLAAALPLMNGRILEVGAGVATPSLCYLYRTTQAGYTPQIVAIEMFDDIEAIAKFNIAQNQFENQLSMVNVNIFDSAAKHEAMGLLSDCFDHIFSNPPFFDPKSNKTSTNDYKALAHSIEQDDLEKWLIFMVRLLKNKACLTLIYPMEQLYKVMKILENRVGDITIRPIFSKPNGPATRFMLQGKKGSKAPLKMLEPLVLRDKDGNITPLADDIFRHAKPVNMA